MTILGARPQFIKATPVCKALKSVGINEILVHTGQHYDALMSSVFFEQLDIPTPKVNLDVGSGSHALQTARMMKKLDAVLTNFNPRAVLVYGDTNTTLAGALTASKLGITVIHIEAGLRSYNRNMPEEKNRVVTDHISDFLFCPTQTAIENLRQESVLGESHLIGDTMKDAVEIFTSKALAESDILGRLKLENRSFLLATIHRPYNTDNKDKLKQLFEAFKKAEKIILLPLHPRLQKNMKQFELNLPENVISTPPLSYFDMLVLQKSADVILTDSGGIQKEAYFNKTPCLTLRPETEWVETIEEGCNRLAWHTIEEILAGIEWALTAPQKSKYRSFGDGKASFKAAKIIKGLF